MIEVTIQNTLLIFETDRDVFSPSGIDRGTQAMLSRAGFQAEDKVLDLGCGYGPVGILAAKRIGQERVVMCDVSQDAVALAATNAARNGVPGIRILHSDGFSAIPDKDFTLILSNPPYHTDFSVAKSFIEEGYRHLAIGGRMMLVTKRLDWYKNKLTAVFGGVRTEEVDGYYVFCSEKRELQGQPKIKPRKGLSKKLRRKYGGSN